MTGKPGDIREREWRVAEIDRPCAQRLVREHHYSRGGSNTGVYFHGLFRVGDAIPRGVAWWLPPTKAAAHALAGAGWQGVLALSRLALEPAVPRNGCSLLLSRSIKMIDRTRWPVLVTYADAWRGHKGGIYKAVGFVDDGDTAPQPVYTIDGRTVGRKRGPRNLSHADLLAAGAVFHGNFRKRRFVLRAAA